MNPEMLSSFGVRSLYFVGEKNDGTNVFEERVVVFTGKDADDALRKAEGESIQYAAEYEVERIELLESYEHDGELLADGVEVWSVYLEAKSGIGDFVSDRYDRYAYKPDSPF